MRSPSPGQRGHWRVASHRRPGGGRPRRRIRGLEPVAQARAGWAGAVGTGPWWRMIDQPAPRCRAAPGRDRRVVQSIGLPRRCHSAPL